MIRKMCAGVFPSTRVLLGSAFLFASTFAITGFAGTAPSKQNAVRETTSLNQGWRFMKYADDAKPDNLIYDVRPEVLDTEDGKAADAKPDEAVKVEAKVGTLKSWILPTANNFIVDEKKHHQRPSGNPGGDFPFVQSNFDDSQWGSVNLPHDWAIAGPFYVGDKVPIGGGMGRLPIQGVAWYRKAFSLSEADQGKSIFLDIEGVMSYAMVWVNGNLVGGWPYGYASWQLDLTPYVKLNTNNQIAIRVDNPASSSRWYPGGGIYRNMWLTKTQPVHVANWGTYITTTEVSRASAKVNLDVTVVNDTKQDSRLSVVTSVYALDTKGKKSVQSIAQFDTQTILVAANSKKTVKASVTIKSPNLWQPMPKEPAKMYVAVSEIKNGNQLIDQYETPFGVRNIIYDANKGLLVNGERVEIKGVNQHHDLGALGAAFNVKAAERQLNMLKMMGVNAVRLSHNPPAPELLELTDRMGFLVIDEIFDVWERKKTPLDFHLIFPEWSEPDVRAFIRRDRNHPSVIMWSVGNEVGEQYTEEAGAAVGKRLHDIAQAEDPTRPTAASMNYAKPPMPFPGVMSTLSLNYQGEGIRDTPAYEGMNGIHTAPLYPSFHKSYPDKMIFSSETAAAVSSRGEYIFPVTEYTSAPAKDGSGGDPVKHQVSSYELYTAPFGASADKVFATIAKYPYVAGQFVWSGWDYLGEPTPYYSSRSSYFGVIDLAGFKKDRFYLYQSQWRPELPMAHLLPHWNWPERIGKITPVHVFTSGDEAELFLNGKSLGRKKLKESEYRLRWDDVVYTPGEIKVIAYKNGKFWAKDEIKTSGPAQTLELIAEQKRIASDGVDLAFIQVKLIDAKGNFVANANNDLTFSIEGPGEIIATDNGDAANMVSFKSPTRAAFNGLCLVIVRALPGQTGKINLSVSGAGLTKKTVEIIAK